MVRETRKQRQLELGLLGGAADATYDGLDNIGHREGGDIRGNERQSERRERRREDGEARHAGGASSSEASVHEKELFFPASSCEREGPLKGQASCLEACGGRNKGSAQGDTRVPPVVDADA